MYVCHYGYCYLFVLSTVQCNDVFLVPMVAKGFITSLLVNTIIKSLSINCIFFTIDYAMGCGFLDTRLGCLGDRSKGRGGLPHTAADRALANLQVG